jgi:hypothetical protein
VTSIIAGAAQVQSKYPKSRIDALLCQSVRPQTVSYAWRLGITMTALSLMVWSGHFMMRIIWYFSHALYSLMWHESWLKGAGWISVRQPKMRPNPTSGAGWQRWNRADIDLNSRRNPLRNFKYESSSSPGTPPGQEEFRPWALSAGPYSREPARMADERPPNLVQLTTEY